MTATTNRTTDADVRAVDLSTSPVADDATLAHDADRTLRRLQEDVVAIVAHELRTPLTALRGYLQLLLRETASGGTDADAGRRLLGLAEEQAERLDRLIDELFDLARADTGLLEVRPVPTPVRSIIETTVEIAQSMSEQRIDVQHVDDCLVEVDGPRVQQVLLNILTNAQRHARQSPTVAIRARRLRQWLSIEVEDQGPGMSDAVREKLFSRFHVGTGSSAGGLGLGLYISRQIVTAHGGTIEAGSAPGKGTTFTIRLPVSGGQAGPPSAEV